MCRKISFLHIVNPELIYELFSGLTIIDILNTLLKICFEFVSGVIYGSEARKVLSSF